VSEATPPDYKIDIDWNGLLVNAGNAIRVLAELDQNPKIAIYESPIPHEDIEGYQKIRRQIRNPLAIHFGGAPSFSTTLESQMCDGFVVHNGVSDILRKGALAAAFNKPFWLQMVGPGLTTALSAHLGSVLTHAQWPAISCLNIYADDLIVAPHTIAGGYIKVPDAPGLGVEFDESAIAKYKMEPPYELPEPRRILSVKFASGRTVHLTEIWKVWEEFRKGHLPVQEPGVRMEVTFDDGTPEWADLFNRASKSAVYDLTRP